MGFPPGPDYSILVCSVFSGMQFSTKDNDNDRDSGGNCATRHDGAWWYNHCHESNLNGLYLKGPYTSDANGVAWKTFRGWHYSLKRTEMKVKPKSVIF